MTLEEWKEMYEYAIKLDPVNRNRMFRLLEDVEYLQQKNYNLEIKVGNLIEDMVYLKEQLHS
jgi:hypothetical protein